MPRIRVLFVCVHNSARSQMAETFMNADTENRFHAESAGFEPTEINPLVMEVMKEIGFDLSGKETNSVFSFFKQGRLYGYVITVCEESSEGKCPIFPGVRKRLNWPFPDPAELRGTPEAKLEGARRIRDSIRARVKAFAEEIT